MSIRLTTLFILVAGIFVSSVAVAQESFAQDTTRVDSIIESGACGGSCASILRAETGLLLEVRNPGSGQLFRIVPMDLPARASLGPFKFLHDTRGEPAGGEGEEVQSTPNPPHGGTGTVTEIAPFVDPDGRGEIHVTYHFVNHVLRDVVVRKFYHIRYMPR